MIRTTYYGGQVAATVVEGDWRFERTGLGTPWTATHEPTGIGVGTQQTQLDEAKRVLRELAPDLAPGVAAEPVTAVSFSLADRRPGRSVGGARRYTQTFREDTSAGPVPADG